MYDLHLHSTVSDGDLTPDKVANEVKQRRLAGFSLTDHNGLWGVARARISAQELGLEFLEGIEISARYGGADVHILGYAQSFKTDVLSAGLTRTRRGYEERIQAMLGRCHGAGFDKVSFEQVAQQRANQVEPCFVSYDVARELQRAHGLSVADSHRMTVKGGAVYVPYGDWAMQPGEAIDLLHTAGGVAVLAHPGTIVAECSRNLFNTLFAELIEGGLDGVEARHPFHTAVFVEELANLAHEHSLVVTAGSDWHGESRFPHSNAFFGKQGMSDDEWLALIASIQALPH